MRLLQTLTLFGLFAHSCSAFESTDEYEHSEVLFVRRIAPLLREKCLGCHGKDPNSIEGGIDLRQLDTIKRGGDSGAHGIVDGKPDESSIYLAVQRSETEFSAMPPKESEALDATQIEWLRDWIASGAKWPDVERIKLIEHGFASEWSVEDGITVKTSGGLDEAWTNRRYDPKGLWAYQPIKPINVPKDVPSAIDYLIDASMPEDLIVAPPADRITLILRATFDLTGLPPTPEEVLRFSQDPHSDTEAFADLVDRLLESPRYGERLAQHWLDVTRYADSSGFANDYERGNAWRYRDYVVRSFNNDVPYNQFIREQIAGDEIDPNDPTMLVATGFLRMGPWELTGMEVAKVARQRFLDDVTNAVGETFLGHSLQCCRCHDHKFDPIPTKDYYSVQAVFATTQLAERAAAFLDAENQTGFEEKRYLEKMRDDYNQTLARMDQIKLANAIKWFDAQGKDRSAWDKALKNAKRKGEKQNEFEAARALMKKQGFDEQDYPPVNVGFTPQEFGEERVARKGLQRLAWEFDRYDEFALAVYSGRTPSLTAVYTPLRVADKPMTEGELEQTAILAGGDPFSPTLKTMPGVLSVLADQAPADIPDAIVGRRLTFANWVANPKNPLTSRVIANRLWQWHFGRAIAGNPNNFGSTGKRPTHPDLLDWLAGELVANQWSLKSLHRVMMNSAAYRRGTAHPDPKKLNELDPERNSYAAFEPRRLSAEELRDSMLFVSGELNLAEGGIPCRPIINSEVALQPRQVMGTFAAAWTPSPEPAQRNRRSIYILKLRGVIDPSLEVFNSPSPDFSCERRDASTVTPQVFAMFNSNHSHARALALANRSIKLGQDDEAVIGLIYNRLFCRSASPQEITRCIEHWRQVESMLTNHIEHEAQPPKQITREAVEENTGEKFAFTETLYAVEDFVPDLQPSDCDRKTRALADLCLVLMNCNEFVYLY